MPLKGGLGNWIKDFKKSDAPQFKGKSDEKKRDMAIAAYLDAKEEYREESGTRDIHELSPELLGRYSKKARGQIQRATRPKDYVAPKQSTKDKAEKRYKGLGSAINRGVARGTNWNKGPSTRDDTVKQSTMTGKKPEDIAKIKGYKPKDKATAIHQFGSKVAKKLGFGETSTPSRLKTYLNESTNWKGTAHIMITRFAAKQGFGIQLTQNRRMPNDKRSSIVGAYASLPMKEVPKLIKALQKVMKAPTNVQTGDDD